MFAGATPNFGGGVPMHEKGGDSSTTYATLTEGNIVIGGKKVTAAELGVNTDAATAHSAIEAMPNAELQLANQQAMANAMGTVVATSKQIANDVQAYKAKKAVEAYFADLTPKEKANFNAMDVVARDAVLTRDSQAYRDSKQWGIGGDNSRALEAVTTLLVGATSGQGGGQVVANALAPYAANLIGDKFDANHGSDPNAALQLLSHALLGALLAEVNGGNAAGGAGAAAGGELAAKLLTEALYPGYIGELDDQQKQTILALSQAVAAVAGSSAGDGLAGAAFAAGIAKNSVENNFLTEPQAQVLKEQLDECGADKECQQMIQRVAKEVSRRMDHDLLSVCTADATSPACQAFVGAAVSYKYGNMAAGLEIYDDLSRSSQLLGSFAHSAQGDAYRGLIFENGGLKPVYILPQEYTVAALAEWTGGVDKSIDQYGLWSKEAAGEIGLGFAQLLARRYGMANIVGGSGGFGKGGRSDSLDSPRPTATPVFATNKEARQGAADLGFTQIKETVHSGELVFKKGNLYITRDRDGHAGGAWKMATSVRGLESKDSRAGTYDSNLRRIGK